MKSFMYHYVRDDSEELPYSSHKTSTDFVSEILEFKHSGYDFQSPRTCLKHHNPNSKILNSILLTFDDGLKDHLYAAKRLKQIGVDNAVFYIPVEPYLTGQVLPVHKAQFIRSKYGARSLSLLKEAAMSIGIDLAIDYENPCERRKFKNRYSKQVDEEDVKEFKRLINYTGDLKLRNCLLDEIMVMTGSNLTVENLYLNASEIREIADLGFEIGSHGLSHIPFSRLGPNEQAYELEASKAFLEQVIYDEVTSFCYPYGGRDSYTDYTLELLHRKGYANALTVEPRDILSADIKDHPFEIPRYDSNLIPAILESSKKRDSCL